MRQGLILITLIVLFLFLQGCSSKPGGAYLTESLKSKEIDILAKEQRINVVATKHFTEITYILFNSPQVGFLTAGHTKEGIKIFSKFITGKTNPVTIIIEHGKNPLAFIVINDISLRAKAHKIWIKEDGNEIDQILDNENEGVILEIPGLSQTPLSQLKIEILDSDSNVIWSDTL